MNYQERERSVPATITGDSLWKMEVYRLSLFAGDLAWEDATKLICAIAVLADCRINYIEPSGPSAPMLAKATRVVPAGTERFSTVKPLALGEKAAIGITKAGTCWENQ